MPPDPKTIWLAIVLPSVVALAITLFSHKLGRWGGLIGAAVAATFAGVMPSVIETSPWAVRSGWHVLFWIAVGLAVLGVAARWIPSRAMPYVAMAVGIGAAVAISQARVTQARNAWTWRDAVLWLPVGATILTATPLILTHVQKKRGALAPAGALAMAALVSVIAIGFLGKSATLAQLAFAPSALAGGVAVAVALRRKAALPLALWIVLTVLVQGVLLATLEPWYASMPVIDGILLLLAPLAAVAGLSGVTQNRWASAGVAILAVLLCCGVPIAHIIMTARRYQDDGYL